jgi:hypothetical protein
LELKKEKEITFRVKYERQRWIEGESEEEKSMDGIREKGKEKRRRKERNSNRNKLLNGDC